MKLLISSLISPLSILWILVLLYLVKAKRFFLITIVVWFFLISTSFFPDFLVSRLENKYSNFPYENLRKNLSYVHILVLGGGHSDDKLLMANDKLSYPALSRVVEGIRLKKQLPQSILITSGYGLKNQNSQAEILAETAFILGIDSSQIRLQKKPVNTWSEALAYKNSYYTDSSKLIIVTSAVHMPRAMYLFQKAGLNPIPSPTDHLIKSSDTKNFWYWLPSSGNILKMESAIHEYLGLFCAKLF